MSAPAPVHHRRLHLRRPTWRGWFTIAVLSFLVVIVIAWAIDYRSLGDRVTRNVTVENASIGRLEGPALQRALATANRTYGKGEVVFIIDGHPHPMSASEIGLRLDEPATIAAARQIGRNDPPVLRPFTWAASFVVPRRAEVRIRLDRGKLATALATLPGQVPVIEPTVVGSAEKIGVSSGKGGYGFDPEAVAKRIESVARDGTLPIRVTLVARPIAPRVSDDDIKLLALEAAKLTNRSIEIDVPGRTMNASPETLRGWITSVVPPGSSRAHLVLDADEVRRSVEEQIGGVVQKPLDATFTVVGNQVFLVPQVNGTACCSQRTASVVFAALRADRPSVNAPLVPRKAAFTTEDARKLGITTLLGTGQGPASQVTLAPQVSDLPNGTTSTTAPSSSLPETTTTTLPNGGGPGQFIVPVSSGDGVMANVLHAIPFIRGRIIMPGKTLSLNDILGAPSPANGYQPAVIPTADGPSYVSGGGTGLVAAALFQAAFYGGLDIPTSGRHDTALPGVPLGIEATLGWPTPDLVVKNPSSHAVLIWIDLASGGVRAQLFSTPFASSVQVSQNVVPFGPDNKCQAVTTTRTRTFTDGQTATDTFTARYTPPPGGRDDPDRVICPS